MKCSFRGFTFKHSPGDRIYCPVCEERLIIQNRDGRAWTPAHEAKKQIISFAYQHCHKGENK